MHKFAMLLLIVAAGTGIVAGNAHADASSTPKNQPKTHVVASGETLSSIAAANNLPSWLPLWDVNTSLQNPDQIDVGQQLIIPAAPYPTTDRALPSGYGAPAPVVSTATVAAVTATAPVAKSVVGSPGGLAQRVCARESGCNYATNTGNGYSGAYQFDASTWGDFDGYPAAYLAPPAVQDQKFQQEYAARGCSPWPNTCY
ncbi:MAG TPA: LysM peptidoglycan-binding domain-containing protein [Candidatus Saccharimonadales bacterium]|nr:LysM peptidoglycan-binding domain-containing protein [Candidatus Saccharimonadales bacterium]